MQKLLFFICSFVLLLCESKAQEGFIASPFGFKYKMHTANTGEKVQENDEVQFHQYVRKGDSLIQSTRLIQSGEPLTIQMPEDVNADKFINAIKMMAVNDSMTLAIVIDSLGENAVRPPFQAGELIYFDFKMLAIKKAKDVEAEKAITSAREEGLHKDLDEILKKYKKGELKTQKTASGLKYLVIEQGRGAKPQTGESVSVHYIGVLKDGTEFDNSFKRGQPIAFPLGKDQVIKGWDEGIALLNIGGKAVFFIPGNLAYGKQPPPGSPIKRNSELVFYVELVK
jgi:FKBP-type peptidyl-prolyl cis-trans isomerase FkpA